MVGLVDADGSGRLLQYDVQGSDLTAADLIDSEIRRDDNVSPFVTLRNRDGSTVRFGEMQMVLVEDTVVYVRPLYIESATENAVPQILRVIAVNGNRIAMRETLDEAVQGVTVDGFVPGEVIEEDPDDPAPDLPEGELDELSVVELLTFVESKLNDADRVAESDPDLAAELRAEALDALDRLGEVLGVPVASASEPAGA